MTIDYDRLMRFTVPDTRQAYTEKDSILYALGIGLGIDPTDADQLCFVYERDLKSVPTQVMVLALPTGWLVDSGIDYGKVVHGEQAVTFHQPLPPRGVVTAKLSITDVIDKGRDKGALVYVERTVFDAATGTLLATIQQTIFARGDGGFGGPTRPQAAVHRVPDRTPDGHCELPTCPQQALIYRLSGDYNPLHADPVAAQRAGFDRPILHGLATFGVAAHALLKSVCGYEPTKLASIAGRFTAPVFPGERLVTDYWIDYDVISFRTRVVDRAVVAIGNGRATIRG